MDLHVEGVVGYEFAQGPLSPGKLFPHLFELRRRVFYVYHHFLEVVLALLRPKELLEPGGDGAEVLKGRTHLGQDLVKVNGGDGLGDHSSRGKGLLAFPLLDFDITISQDTFGAHHGHRVLGHFYPFVDAHLYQGLAVGKCYVRDPPDLDPGHLHPRPGHEAGDVVKDRLHGVAFFSGDLLLPQLKAEIPQGCQGDQDKDTNLYLKASVSPSHTLPPCIRWAEPG